MRLKINEFTKEIAYLDLECGGSLVIYFDKLYYFCDPETSSDVLKVFTTIKNKESFKKLSNLFLESKDKNNKSLINTKVIEGKTYTIEKVLDYTYNEFKVYISFNFESKRSKVIEIVCATDLAVIGKFLSKIYNKIKKEKN